MATRIKGNFTTTNANAPKFQEVGYTSQNLLDIYTARVVADGGEIIDPAATLAAIDYARSRSLLSRMTVMASPSWGVKKTSGRYDKLYSISGTDFESFTVGVGGVKPLADTDADGNVIAITDINASRVGGLFRTTQDITTAASEDDWFVPVCGSYSALDGLTAQVAFGNLPQSTTGFICAGQNRTATLNSYFAQRSDYAPLSASSSTTRITGNVTNTGIANTVGLAIMLKISTGQVRLIIDGDVKAAVTASTNELYDYVTLARRLYLGGGYDGSVNITASRKMQLREVCAINRATEAEVLSLTEAISARYE